jgi:hypothetical protein
MVPTDSQGVDLSVVKNTPSFRKELGLVHGKGGAVMAGFVASSLLCMVYLAPTAIVLRKKTSLKKPAMLVAAVLVGSLGMIAAGIAAENGSIDVLYCRVRALLYGHGPSGCSLPSKIGSKQAARITTKYNITNLARCQDPDNKRELHSSCAVMQFASK